MAMVGAGFISFTILNSVLSHGVNLHIIEIMPQILPRYDRQPGRLPGARLAGAEGGQSPHRHRVQAIEDVDGRKKLVIGERQRHNRRPGYHGYRIRTNLEWLEGSGIEINQGIIVDDHLRSNVPNVYAAGDVAEGAELITGNREVHAIEPTAMEHGRIVGANMVGRDIAYRGSLLMNILDVQDLDIASFGDWSGSDDVTEFLNTSENVYRKLVWNDDRITGAILMGPARSVWDHHDVGMLKGLIQSARAWADGRPTSRRTPGTSRDPSWSLT